MIGASLKAAAGDSKEFDTLSAVKDFGSKGAWRGVDIVSGQLTWTSSAASIQAIPGNVRTWVDNAAAGKNPWQEPADAAAS
jgi:hypothetical protein